MILKLLEDLGLYKMIDFVLEYPGNLTNNRILRVVSVRTIKDKNSLEYRTSNLKHLIKIIEYQCLTLSLFFYKKLELVFKSLLV